MTGFYSFIRLLLAVLFVLPLWTGAVAATATAKNSVSAAGPAVRNTKGLLWKIESPGAAANYLFGTIHSDDPRITALPDAVTRTLDASTRFVMEAIIDGESLMRMAEVMFFNDERTLEQVVGRKLYAESVKALSARGMPTLGVEKQKPWAVMMALSMPPPRTGEFLDLVLQARAAQQNKPVSGLETVAEQLAIFDELPLRDQVALLEDTVRLQPELDREFEALHKAWLARDLAAIIAISEKHKPTDERLYQEGMDRLIVQRNRRMAERMTPMLKQGGAFIAVGAAHLPGETGLLQLIEKAGYRVTAIY
ncbi:polysaccharide biosynthesis protein GumN [Sulfuricaulis limicola]|uniref:Polysaccharide biosynthesis protein GumN n=2 Tax=Sulfuricaulis limicola TaxID=1620215 RepID=A0A1B4XHA0_9GAMM|nr:polysaccharide biosynthesis protein GumN [Sulfuricaulis limicola]